MHPEFSSPPRPGMLSSPMPSQLFTPTRPGSICTHGFHEPLDLSPQSPASAIGSPADPSLRRGRPRAEVINNLINRDQISSPVSGIICKFCNRAFPREKSLQAHLRTHTGERPYQCDYPGCIRAFTQSGQLKTHQRLHTGEKPFICTVKGCSSRFTHANRHCSDHPTATLRRDQTPVVLTPPPASPTTPEEKKHTDAVNKWFQKQMVVQNDRLTPQQKQMTQSPCGDVQNNVKKSISSRNQKSTARKRLAGLDATSWGQSADAEADMGVKRLGMSPMRTSSNNSNSSRMAFTNILPHPVSNNVQTPIRRSPRKQHFPLPELVAETTPLDLENHVPFSSPAMKRVTPRKQIAPSHTIENILSPQKHPNRCHSPTLTGKSSPNYPFPSVDSPSVNKTPASRLYSPRKIAGALALVEFAQGTN